jgi:hypothetical protein
MNDKKLLGLIAQVLRADADCLACLNYRTARLGAKLHESRSSLLEACRSLDKIAQEMPDDLPETELSERKSGIIPELVESFCAAIRPPARQ